LIRIVTDESPRPFPRLLALVVSSLLLLLGLAALSSYRDLAAARERKEALRQEILQTREANEELVQRIERLRSDPATLERLAREQYRMMRPEDLVIVLPEEPQEPPSVEAGASPQDSQTTVTTDSPDSS
jgi:cell division protein FtsB